MSKNIPFAPSCERNKYPILDVLKPLLQEVASVLEIGSGTGQHAVFFNQQFPDLHWQTSDLDEHLSGIRAQFAHTQTRLPDPLVLDVAQPAWLSPPRQYEMIFTANTLHIMPWQQVEDFFNSLGQVSQPGTQLAIYGPFKYKGEFTSPSNAQFDQVLRDRNVGSAIRDFEAVNALAEANSYQLLVDHAMPANNQCIIWRHIMG